MLSLLGICQCFCTSPAQTADTMLSTAGSLFMSHVFLSASKRGSNPSLVFYFFYNNFSFPPSVFQSAFLLMDSYSIRKASFTDTFIYMCRHACTVPCTAVSAHSVCTSHMVAAIVQNFHLNKLLMGASYHLSLFLLFLSLTFCHLIVSIFIFA